MAERVTHEIRKAYGELGAKPAATRIEEEPLRNRATGREFYAAETADWRDDIDFGAEGYVLFKGSTVYQ